MLPAATRVIKSSVSEKKIDYGLKHKIIKLLGKRKMTKSLEPRSRQRLLRFDIKSISDNRKIHKTRPHGLLCKTICYDERQIIDK